MDRSQFYRGHVCLLVIVGNLDIVNIAIRPTKTDSPLVFDMDTVLAGPDLGKMLQSVARWRSQVRQRYRRIEDSQLALGTTLHIWW